MKRTFKSVLCLVLTVAMLVSVLAVSVSATLPEQLKTPSRFQSLDAISDEIVRAIVVLEGDAVIDLGVDPNSEAGLAHERNLLTGQTKFLRNAGGLEAAYHYTGLFNGVAVDIAVSQLKKLEQMDGVAAVYIANTYAAPEYDVLTEDEIQANWASIITGASSMGSIGYNGDGIVVAVLDTGINLGHEVLQPNELITAPALDQATVEAADTVGGVYVSEKIPYSYDYYDMDTDCTDENGHGSHVSGIIGGYKAGENGVEFSGAAPAVQLLGMKIFGATGGTNSSIYFAALEDAYRLNADAVNMSLGSPSGFTYDWELENELYGNVYEKLHDAGIAVFCSAGNDTNMGYYNMNPSNLLSGVHYVLADYTDYGVVGSPSVYPWNVSVASADNLFVPMEGVGFDGENYFYATDPNEGFANSFRATFEGQTVGFVYLPGFGAPEEYVGLDVTGKIVAVDRGDLSFQEKIDNAAAAGAIGCIVVNNDPTPLNMSVENITIPAICVDMGAKAVLTGMTEITVTYGMFDYQTPTAFQVSEYSSWGTTGDLQFKPQITGIGGYVYSSVAGDSDAYDIYSGTSMACPNVVGTYAAMLQYLREVYPEATKYELANFAEDLLMSTADILVDSYGYESSPRQQGAGLANAVNAVLAPAFISNPTVTLGDDPEMSGVLEMTFEVVSLSDETRYYYLEPIVLTDYPTTDGYAYYSSMTSSNLGYDYGWGVYSYDVYTVYEDGKTDTGDVFALEAGSTAEVTITLSVNPALLAQFASIFTNGLFLEGFVNFYDYEQLLAWQLGMADIPAALFHGSYISYCGDWTAAPAMESIDTMDLVDVQAWLASMGMDPAEYLLSGMIAQGMFMNVNYTQAYMYSMMENLVVDMGANPFSSDYYYVNPDRIAFSTAMSNADLYYMDSFLIIPSMLRNCRHLIMTVSDAVTGEVYYVDDTEYVRKDVIDETKGIYQATTEFLWDGTYAYELNGEIYYDYVPSGTKVNVVFESVLDYPGAQPQVEWATTVTVDYTAPEILYDYDADSKKLNVIVSDNEYLAAFFAYGQWTDVGEVTFDGQMAGQGYGYTIDLSRYQEDVLYLELSDFATNVVGVAIPLTEGDISNYPANVEILETEGAYVEVIEGDILYEDMYVMVVVEDGYCLTEEFALLANGEAAELVYIEDGIYLFCIPVDNLDLITLEVVGVMAHEFLPVMVQTPDCCSIGYQEYYCTNCASYGYDEWIDALGHTPAEEYVPYTEATCDGQGVSVLYCTVCDEILDVQVADETGHTYGELVIVRDATCVSDGYGTRSCTDCGVILEVEVLAATGHIDGDWVVDQSATCSTDGYQSLHCAVCDEVIAEETLPATGHTEDEAVTVLEPTCETKGYATVSCVECGNLLYGQVLDATGHVPGEAQIVSEPTCESDGYSETYCTVCECLMKTDKLDALGHVEGEWTVVKEATYTSEGEEKQYCEECGEELASRDIARLLMVGDVDNNGKISAVDYILIKRNVMGTLELDEQQLLSADINGDGRVNAMDYVIAKRMVMGTYNPQ